MDQQPAKLWTKNFILAIVVNLFISMVFYLLMTTMALYAVDRFQASDTAAGFASSALCSVPSSPGFSLDGCWTSSAAGG